MLPWNRLSAGVVGKKSHIHTTHEESWQLDSTGIQILNLFKNVVNLVRSQWDVIHSYSNSYILFATLANRGILKGHPDFQKFEQRMHRNLSLVHAELSSSGKLWAHPPALETRDKHKPLFSQHKVQETISKETYRKLALENFIKNFIPNN